MMQLHSINNAAGAKNTDLNRQQLSPDFVR
jgi:hypothetical protein